MIGKQNLFVSGEGGYHTYRIPALVLAANGDLLVSRRARGVHGAYSNVACLQPAGAQHLLRPHGRGPARKAGFCTMMAQRTV